MTTLATIDRLEGNAARAAERLRTATMGADEHFARSQVGAEAWRELALALDELDEPGPARAAAERSVEILTATEDFAPQERASSHLVLGRILLHAQDLVGAQRQLDRAAAAWALAPNQPGSGAVTTALLAGDLAAARGDRTTAQEHYTAAVDTARTRLGAEHPLSREAQRRLAQIDAPTD